MVSALLCFALLSICETTCRLTFAFILFLFLHQRNGKLSNRFLEDNPGATVLDFGGPAVDDMPDVPARPENLYGWARGRVYRTLLITEPNSAELRAAGVTERVLQLFVEQVTGIRPFFASLPTQSSNYNIPAYINFRSHRDMSIASDIIDGHTRIVVNGRYFCDIYATQVK